MFKKKSNAIYAICMIALTFILFYSCGGGDDNGTTNDKIATPPENDERPLNLAVFVDLSDRITKTKDNMPQYEKDKIIVDGLAERFINKQDKGFQQSNDRFQVVFYPAPAGAQTVAKDLTLDLKNITGPKKKQLLAFKRSYSDNVKQLYDSALVAPEYFGSDIWGYFAKDKVADLHKDGYRNVLVILSDGYVFDKNNKVKEGKNYSYIMPQTLAVEGSGLIPCKISNNDFEVYFIECNANPQTDYMKMKSILETWFKEMGINKVDIQDTDLPASTLKHLNGKIFGD